MSRKRRIARLALASLVMLLWWQYERHPQEADAATFAQTSKLGIVVTQINLQTRDLIYDSHSNKIYASIPSSAGIGGNSIAAISVPTMTVGTPVFVGSEPNKLAVSDDGKYLYVGLDGAAGVRRFTIASQSPDIQFSLGSGFCGARLAEDMVVIKGQPNSVAISLRNTGCSPRHEGVAIYDDGISRPTRTPGHTGSNVIEPSESASVLYGYNNETTDFGFRIMTIDSTGVQITSAMAGLISGFGTDIRFDNGLIYATNGAVVNPDTLTLLGSYAASGLVLPDSVSGRVYFVSNEWTGPVHLKVFDQATFVPLASIPLPAVSGTPSSMIKVGQDLLAFRTSNSQVFLLRLIQLDKSVYLPLVTK